ncbi:MAG: TonB-dependent receptor [Chitinophagaceae bacterium]|nr:TonB-dependent receptor [Chitinophagaceae bacterium]
MRSFATLISTLLFSCVFGQAPVRGKLIDAVNRQPIESATILSVDSIALGVTDQQGYFLIPAVQKTIRIVSAGYAPLLINISPETELKIALQPAAIRLQDVLVLQKRQFSTFQSLTKIDLDLRPVRNTQELMRVVPGLFVAQHAGGGKAEQIFLRGFDCDHGTDVAVSVDGMPVNMVSHAHGQGYADAHFIIPETVNRIDFGAGLYYAQHGDLNTAGYVDLSTYNSIAGNRVQLEAGRFNSYRVLGMFDLLKHDKDRQSAYLASEYNYTDGATINPQHFIRFNLFGKYRLAISDRTQLTASASAFSSKWNASGQIPERAVASGLTDRFGSIDPTEGGRTERYNANILLTHRFSSQAGLDLQAYYSRYLFNLYSNFSFFLEDSIHGDAINQAEERNLFGFHARFSSRNEEGQLHWNAVYGAGMRRDIIQNSRLAHVEARRLLDDITLGDIGETNAFAYTRQELSIGNWSVEAGLRADYLQASYVDRLHPSVPSRSQIIFNPKLNLQYTFSRQTQLYLKAGRGFHSNDARVIVANQGQGVLPAAYGADLGIILKPAPNLLINIAAWWLYLDQEFVYVGDDGNIEPSGRSKRIGIDWMLHYQFDKHWFANLNLNLTRPKAVDAVKGQDYLPLAPVATSTGGIFYKNPRGLNGSISYRYMKDRPANESNSIVAKGYWVTDLALNYTRPGFEIGLAVENLLNTEWNEAQFATTSRLRDEPAPVTELNFTPGTPVFARLKFAVFF